MAEISRAILFVLKAVLNLQLSVRSEAITCCNIGAPEIMTDGISVRFRRVRAKNIYVSPRF